MIASARAMCALVLLAAALCGCAREPAGFEIPTGTDVSVERHDGATVAGRLAATGVETVTIEQADGRRVIVPRAEIRALRVTPAIAPGLASADEPQAPPAPPGAPQAPAAPRPDESTPLDPASAGAEAGRAEAAAEADARAARLAAGTDADEPAYRDVQIPAGTALSIALETAVGSETSRVEDRVRGTLRRAIAVDGVEVVPAGAVVLGTVTEAERSGRVKGRARVAFRFSTLDLPGERPRLAIRTAVIAREAEGTKKEDAAKIGGGAAAGAVIGGLIGGGDGAAKGAAIGGGAGTGVVLATRGREVSLPAGTTVSARLLDPIVVRVPR